MAFSTLRLRARLLRLGYVASLLLSHTLTLDSGRLCAQGAEPNPATRLHVEVDRGTLAVHVRNAPLAQVLRALGEQAGIQVTVSGDVSSPVTHSFAGVPLEEGIRRLAHGYSLVLTHTAAAGTSRAAMLTRVWVLGGASTPDPVASATSAPEPRAAPQRQARGQPGGSRQVSVPASEATRASQRADWLQVIQTFTAAADHGSAAAVALLGDIMATEADAVVRHHAVAALGRLPGVEVEPVLTDALGDTESGAHGASA
jgi:hypothetical protein